MANPTPITFESQDEASRRRAATIEDMFLLVAQALNGLTLHHAQLDDALPGSPRFHRLLRQVEAAEEHIIAGLDAIMRLQPSTGAQVHLRRFARDLQVALALEDGSDAAYFVNALQAWPDLLFLPTAEAGASEVNALVQFCLNAVIEQQDRRAPSIMALRVLPDAGPTEGTPSALMLH